MLRAPPVVKPSFRSAIEAITGGWPESDVSTSEYPHLQDVVDGIGGLDLEEVPSIVAPSFALAFAIVDGHGRLRCVDPELADLFLGESSPISVLHLIKRAERGGPAVGLAESPGGRVIAVCAASPQQAASWPLSPTLQAALGRFAASWVLMAFAPARASEVARKAAVVFGLSDLESRIAAALLEAPTLEIAAGRIGIGRETARDALDGAMRKIGVKRTPALVRRLTELMCGGGQVPGDAAQTLGEALNLTAGEARVVQLSAQGATTTAVADTLGIKPETVKSHLRAAFGKTGLNGSRDLGRVDLELHALRQLSRAQEVVSPAEPLGGRLRMIVRPGGRRVAFFEYGPKQGRPLVVCHALASGRTLRPPLAQALQRAGFRAIVPQRPGFGLTDAVREDYLATAADDTAGVLDALKCEDADVFARDIASAPILAFAERHPGRVGRGVLLNPQAPVHKGGRHYAISSASRLLQRHPELAEGFFELLRRQTRSDRLAGILLQSFKAGAPSDIQGLKDADLLSWMVHDIQAMVAQTAAGVVRERLIYARGWRPPVVVGGVAWTVAHCAELGEIETEQWWRSLPNVRFEAIAEGGLLLPLTHPQAIVRLLTLR